MAGQGIERREVLRILAMAAAAAQFGGFRTWSFACGHLGTGQIKPATYQPVFFNNAEYSLLERLTDLIIPNDGTPGAREAGVAEFVDFMVAHDPSAQPKFRAGLRWINAHAEQLHAKSFLYLSGDEQISLLESLAYKEKFRQGDEDGREFFQLLRRFTVMGFYTSEIGFRDLDNPALKLYADSPECPHKDDPEHLHLPPVA